jgi:hypothetical protein
MSGTPLGLMDSRRYRGVFRFLLMLTRMRGAGLDVRVLPRLTASVITRRVSALCQITF